MLSKMEQEVRRALADIGYTLRVVEAIYEVVMPEMPRFHIPVKVVGRGKSIREALVMAYPRMDQEDQEVMFSHLEI